MLKTLLKVQFAALKASLFRSRRQQSKGGPYHRVCGAVPLCHHLLLYHVRQHVFFYLHAAA